MTQADQLVRYLEEFGSVTPLEALRDLGIMRLGARIWELKKRGANITTRLLSVPNRWGKACHVAEYTLQRGGGSEDHG